jgi:pantoate--beta-alanine ligase
VLGARRQKDAMQCVLIRKLARELNFPTEVVVVPTQREADGLAMSSRNVVSLCQLAARSLLADVPTLTPAGCLDVCVPQYLSPEERAAAPTLYRALAALEAQYARAAADGETVDAARLVATAMRVLETEPLFTRVDYISIADADSFQELEVVTPPRPGPDANLDEAGGQDHGGGGGGSHSVAVVSAAVQIGKTRLIDNILL